METTYIVSGHMRSGTSMMMEALEAGGMKGAYDNSEHRRFELPRTETRRRGFPRVYEGGLIKVLWRALPWLVVGRYRIVFMLRDPRCIEASYTELFKRDAPWLADYHEIMADAIDLMRIREDTHLVVLNYDEVLAGPESAFTALSEQGWPIDAGQAAEVVDPSKQHHKRNVTA